MPVIAASFHPGQRWVSNTESELGLGVVIRVSHRRVDVHFPASGEQRVYATDNAPLSRVQYPAGERVSSENGRHLLIEAVMEANHCLIYSGVDDEGNELVLPERDLNSRVQFSKPQDRLFSGQIDRNQAYILRCDTLEHTRRVQQSGARGLLGARVQLLPHQLYIASEVAGRYAPRVLLADEVGLGKTIEAGLILHQQLISGRAQRVLIVVPDSLLHQWLVEMLRRFNLMFTILDEDRCRGLEGRDDDSGDDDGSDEADIDPNGQSVLPNPFESSQLVLCNLSFLVDHPERLLQAKAADWDLLIVDEAHHLFWSEQQVSAAYQAIETLAQQARGLLLLTATPEQLGLESHFARLRLLDPDRYHDLQAFVDEEQKHQPVNELVQDLLTDGVRERVLEHTELQQKLGDYLGNSVLKGFLSAASTGSEQELSEVVNAGIRDLLDRHGTGRVLFRNTRASVGGFPERKLFTYPIPLLDEEGASLAHDATLNWLSEWLEQHCDEKVLLICSAAETAMELEEYLRLRAGLRSSVFHESLSLIQRDRAAAYFADEENGAQVLVSSEIGSEGRNFQFAHHLVMFDLPLNPDLLEQRIGRLDRIGQTQPVQIHVPCINDSPQSVLLQWYHQGLNAFEHTCPAGQALFDEFEQELLKVMANPGDKKSLDALLKNTRNRTEATLSALQNGRDRLLELNSFNQQRADEIVEEVVVTEQRKELSRYMERVFDQFGVEQDHHSASSLVLKPGDHMLVHSFPALPEEGLTVTYQREQALAREDMQYLAWEHPMVSGAMDLVLNGEFGNAAFCTLKLPPLKPGTILLETLFSLSPIAPGELQLQRYLPLTTVRLLVDNSHNDLSAIVSASLLNRLAQEPHLNSARELVRHARPYITAMLAQAEELAEVQRSGILQSAVEAMQSAQQIELERLQALAKVNPNIRKEEISHLAGQADQMSELINSTQLRLDAVRVAMVKE